MTNFEEEMYGIMDKYIEKKTLNMTDINLCREICNIYENKVIANNLTKQLQYYVDYYNLVNICNNDTFSFDDVKIVEYRNYDNFVENNCGAKNLKIKMIVFFNGHFIEICYEMTEEYSDNGKRKYLFYKYFMANNLILKREHNNMKKSFINLTYINELFDKFTIKINPSIFLNLFLKIINKSEIFESLIDNITKNPSKYYYDVSWNSDSDVSWNFESESEINENVDEFIVINTNDN